MIKNIGKFKQWTGEKMGKSHKTRVDTDFAKMAQETESKRVALENLYVSAQAYLKAISKRVEGDDKNKGLAIDTFGASMSAQSYTLPDDSVYGQALLRMGDAHQKIAVAQTELITQFSKSYIDSLERSQAEMKEYQALRKKLQSRRLDYDAKLAKVQKAKKEKPEWEEEMQAAKAKYEETLETVQALMISINDSQDQNLYSLGAYYRSQLAYTRRYLEVLEAIPDEIFPTSPNGSSASLYSGNGPQPRKLSRQNSAEPEGDDRSNFSDDQSSTYSNSHSSTRRNNHLDRAPSTSDLRRPQPNVPNPELSRSMSHLTPNAAQNRKSGMLQKSSNGHAVPSTLHPGRRQPQRQVRAQHNYEATAEDELSIQKGDVIKIIEEINEGWWVGELVDADGVRHEGMFPSNYCEEVTVTNGSFSSGAPLAKRQSSINSSSSESRYQQDEDEAAAYYHETQVQYDEPEEEIVHTPVVRRAPPPPIARQNTGLSATAPTVTNGYSNGYTNGSGNGIVNGNGASNGNGHGSFGGSSCMAPQPAAAAAQAAGVARSTPPPNRPPAPAVPTAARSSTIGTRMPPPPPPARRAGADSTMRQSTVFGSAPPPPASHSPPAGPVAPSAAAVPGTPSMMGYIPRDYFSQQQQDGGGSDSEVGPCRECGCADFTANVFKRGSCNNCFHAH